MDTKDRYTKRHSEDVARYAVFLARQDGLDEATIGAVRLAGLLHDIGKIGMPDHLLRKPGALTDDEYEIVKQHVVLGDLIVRDLPDTDLIRAGIRHHHERWDGTGYVDGLAGEDIPLIARIVAVGRQLLGDDDVPGLPQGARHGRGDPPAGRRRRDTARPAARRPVRDRPPDGRRRPDARVGPERQHPPLGAAGGRVMPRGRRSALVAAIAFVALVAGARPAPANAALLANDDTYTTPFQTRLRVAAPGYLANDIDIVGKPKLLTKTTHGKLNWHDDGRIDYQPNAGFSGVDHFDYQLTSLRGSS